MSYSDLSAFRLFIEMTTVQMQNRHIYHWGWAVKKHVPHFNCVCLQRIASKKELVTFGLVVIFLSFSPPIQPFPYCILYEFVQYPYQGFRAFRQNNLITVGASPSVSSLSTGMTCFKALDLQLFKCQLAFCLLRILDQVSISLPSCQRLSLTT